MKKRILRIIAFVLAAFLSLFIIAAIFIGVKFALPGYKYYKSVVAESPISQKVEEIRSRDNYVTLVELTDTYKNAVISVEDHRFYKHGPVSFKALTRVMYYYLKDGEFNQGGSTITQQLAKNLYFGMEQSAKRKFAEIFIAYDLEKLYSKDEILELYVNCIYFGNGYYNIYDAAKGYYGVEPGNLLDWQALVLAGVPNAPSVYSPANNTQLTYQRQRMVADSMVKNGYLTKAEAEQILSDTPPLEEK